jgi:hypothetical protein
MARGEARWRTWQLVAAAAVALILGAAAGASSSSSDRTALEEANRKATTAQAQADDMTRKAGTLSGDLDRAMRATSTAPPPTTATTSPPTTRATTTTEPPGPKTSFSDGNYRVGIDIAAGTYRSSGTSTSCYWKRLSNFTGENDIIANYLSNSPTTVTILASDAGFQTRSCGTWAKT